MEIAIATRTHPDQWLDADDRLIATVLDVMADQAERQRRKG